MPVATQAELLRKHEKDIAKLKNRPGARPTLGFPMTPSSVVGTGLTVAGPGMVALDLASGTLDFLDIFTDDFEDYLVYLDIYGSTAAASIAMQFRNAGGAYSAAGYRIGVQNLPYAAASSYTAPAAATNLPFFGTSAGAGGAANNWTISSPHRLNAEVKIAGQQVSASGMAQIWGWVGSGVGQATGLRLIPSTGSHTGMFRCYGINPN